jgi:choloylglycine hydrolase
LREEKIMKSKYLSLCVGTVFAVLVLVAVDAYSCTRMFWNTNPDLMIVGRTEDYVTASHPTFVATPRGVKRWSTADKTKRSQSISWMVKYGNVAIYENNRFPNDGMNEAGLTARTLYYLEDEGNEVVAPDSRKKELDEDHWVSFVLDNFAMVAEAVDAIRNKVYIVSVVGRKGSGYSYATPKHLAMADATGDSAIVEIQDGKVVIFHGREFTILTNNPAYQEQLANAAKYKNVQQDKLPVSWSGEAKMTAQAPDEKVVMRVSSKIRKVSHEFSHRQLTKEEGIRAASLIS